MQVEHMAQIAPMLILAGLAAGWASEAVGRAGGYGVGLDLALGMLGSVVVGTTIWVLSGGVRSLTMFLIGFVGAALVIVAQRMLWRSERSETRDAFRTAARRKQ